MVVWKHKKPDRMRHLNLSGILGLKLSMYFKMENRKVPVRIIKKSSTKAQRTTTQFTHQIKV